MISLMLDHSKFTKMPFWMIQIAKNEVFGHFLELGASDRLQIAYDDYTKWSWQVGCHIAHAGSFKNHKNSFLDDPKCQKRVFDHFLELGLLDRLDTAYYDIRQRYQIKKSYALKASPPDIDLSFLIHFGYSINTFITLSITNRITAFISSSSGVHWSPCLFFSNLVISLPGRVGARWSNFIFSIGRIQLQ